MNLTNFDFNKDENIDFLSQKTDFLRRASIEKLKTEDESSLEKTIELEKDVLDLIKNVNQSLKQSPFLPSRSLNKIQACLDSLQEASEKIRSLIIQRQPSISKKSPSEPVIAPSTLLLKKEGEAPGKEILTFIQQAKKNLLSLSEQELEKGFLLALKQSTELYLPEDRTTLLTIAEKLARFYIDKKDFNKAMMIRMQAAQAIPRGSLLKNIHLELSKEDPKLGLKLQPVDTALFKNHSLSVQRRVFDGKSRLFVEGRLSHPIREELEKTLDYVKKSPTEFFKTLPKNFCKGVSVKQKQRAFYQRKIRNGKEFEGDFSSEPMVEADKARIIHFEGVGTISIGNDPKCLSQYNRIQVDLDPSLSEEEAGEKLNILFAACGLGAVASSTREEDTQRIKILQLFRAFYPREAFIFERDMMSFEESVESLKKRILDKIPEMRRKFDLYLDKMYQQEVHSGESVWAVKGLADEVRKLGGVGLMAGIGADSFLDTVPRLISLLKFGALSTQERFRLGLIVHGVSSESDITSGGADFVFTRLLTKKMTAAAEDYIFSGQIQVFYNLDLIERVCCNYYGDFGGTKDPYSYRLRSSIFELAKHCETSPHDLRLNEVCVYSRILPQFIQGIMVPNEAAKKELINILRKEGLLTNNDEGEECVNGVPVDRFIRAGALFQLDYWSPESLPATAFPKEKTYEGFATKDLNGQGKMSSPEGIFQGNFKNGVLDGEGMVTKPNGEKLKGTFKEGQFIQGMMTYPDGMKIVGRFKNYLLEGQGKVVMSNGTTYEGEFRDNALNGKGKITFSNGIKMEGIFKDDLLNGKGKFTSKDGIEIETEFIDGAFAEPVYIGITPDNLNGKGMVFYPDGMRVEGNFIDGRLNGQGKIIDPDGEIIEGIFKDDVLNGLGKMTTAIGTKEGEFRDGELNGKGKDTQFEGQMISEGIFKEGRLHGQGVVVHLNGDVWEGEFRDNQLIKGKMSLANGNVLEGEFRNNELRNGKLTHSNGSVEEFQHGYAKSA